MNSYFYTIVAEDNDDFPEIEEFADIFDEHHKEAGRPNPDTETEQYRNALPS